MPTTEEIPVMDVVCAWCKEWLGFQECQPQNAGTISHGICPDCRVNVLEASCGTR